MEARIIEVTGVMPDSINGYAGYRVFCTMDQQIHERGANLHVFAQKPDRWKAGNTVTVDTPQAGFYINGPGEEALPEDQATYLYAKLSIPKRDGAPAGGGQRRFQPAATAPAPQQRGFTPPAAAPTPAPVATPCQTARPTMTAAEADVTYDAALTESLRAVGTIVDGFYGTAPSELRATITATLASNRATAIFTAQTQGRVGTSKAASIKQLINGLDGDIKAAKADPADMGLEG